VLKTPLRTTIEVLKMQNKEQRKLVNWEIQATPNLRDYMLQDLKEGRPNWVKDRLQTF
jgi:hypothetical protein